MRSLLGMLSVAILCCVIHSAFACVASGVCGGLGGLGGIGMPSPCFSPIPAVNPGCAGGLGGLGGIPGGCGPGYACGSYGCYRVRRARAHSVLTQDGDRSPVSLFGYRPSEAPSRPPSDPNAAFLSCCEQRGLPDACLSKCTFNTYTKDALTRMYFKQDACPVEASAEIQYCAAQGRDHRACCARNGVTSTLSGDKCLTFCDQRPGNVTMLDMTYIGCYDRFDNMKSCFWHDLANRLSYQ